METVVTEIPWWAALAELAVSGLAATLIALVAATLPLLRNWLAEKYLLAAVLRDSALAQKLDEGALNIIRAAEKHLLDAIPGDHVSPPVSRTADKREQIVDKAKPMLESEFKETLEHFGKTPDAVRDYLLARVDRALN